MEYFLIRLTKEIDAKMIVEKIFTLLKQFQVFIFFSSQKPKYKYLIIGGEIVNVLENNVGI